MQEEHRGVLYRLRNDRTVADITRQQTDIGKYRESVSIPPLDPYASRIGNAEHPYRDISIEFHGLFDTR